MSSWPARWACRWWKAPTSWSRTIASTCARLPVLRAVHSIYRRLGRRLPRPHGLPAGQHARRARAHPAPGGRAPWRWPTRSAPASRTTRRSMPTCRASSNITSTRNPSSANVETHICREPEGLAYTLDHLSELVTKPVGESGGYGITIGPARQPGGARSVPCRADRQSRELDQPADDRPLGRPDAHR